MVYKNLITNGDNLEQELGKLRNNALLNKGIVSGPLIKIEGRG